MTIDYHSYPKAALTRVVPRAFQVVGHRFNNKAFGIPEPLVSRFVRPSPQQQDWTLPDTDPQWDELLSYVEAQKLYGNKSAKPVKPAVALAAEMEADRRRVAREQYWARVRALPGGSDPLWRYGSQSAEDTDDYRWMLRDDSRPQVKPWFPRLQLRLKYGTTSLQEYAAQHGVHYPD